MAEWYSMCTYQQQSTIQYFTHTLLHIYQLTHFLLCHTFLRNSFKKIKKFYSWSNHFIWKDTLTATSICLLQVIQNLQKAIHKIWYAHHSIRYAHTFVLFNSLNTTNINIMANCALNMTETPMSISLNAQDSELLYGNIASKYTQCFLW